MAEVGDFSAIVAGAELPVLEVEIDRLAVVKYAGASDDYVHLHWDHPFMIANGYPDVIVHGWLTFAHMCRAVTEWAPPRIAAMTRYAVRYHRPCHPGLLLCGGTVMAADGVSAELSLWGRNATGDTLATGSVTLTAVG